MTGSPFCIGCGLDSTPESDLILPSGKGRYVMENRSPFCGLWITVSNVWITTLARIRWLCSRVESRGIGITLIPGLLVWNVALRAGGSGRAHNERVSVAAQM
jgi:hypothetical protein